MNLFLKKLMIPVLLFLDKFKDYEKSFDEKFHNPLEIDTPIVVRNKDNNFVIMTEQWISKKEGENIRVYISASPFVFNLETPLFQSDQSTFTIEGLPTSHRLYFHLITDSGTEVTIAERLIPFKGMIQFRDLGGYPTVDGKRVKWGAIFRSDHLNKFRKSEFGYLNKLKLQTIFDFRGATAVKRFPDHLPKDHTITALNLPIVSPGLEMREITRRILKNDMEGFDTKAVLLDAYRHFIVESKDSFKMVFQKLLEGEAPLLVHCTAGKDRTGYISAMVLTILGVERSIVFEDYLASNYFRKKETAKYLDKAALFVDPNTLVPLFEVQREYLEMAFTLIEEKYGSIKNYVIEAMGFSEEDIEQLKTMYLEA